MPSLFRRKSNQLVEGADPESAAAAAAGAELAEATEAQTPRGYTPSKKERGISTPKRPNANLRRPDAAGPPRSRKDLSKEERRELKEERRQRRREISEGMKRGDQRYLSARDRGPERAIARDVVDSRRTAGTWFFAGALFVLLFSGAAMPDPVRLIANLAWALLAVAVITDSWLLCRKTKRLVRERHPDSTERMGALYFYVIMRALTFRRLRIPQPGRKFGEKI